MKHYPPPAPPRGHAPQRRRLPAFHPVPVSPRADGWTAKRQADFIGCLAQTRSVLAAARAVAMGRESAYRLRKRPGAAGFAAAWDAALGKPHRPVNLSSAKATGLDARYRLRAGLIQVAMEQGRYVGSYWKDDANALLEHLAQLDRSSAGLPEFTQRSQQLQPGSVSTRSVDFGGG